ncbi:MAG: GTP pyrophosphokinase family protein [Eubacterium sp.]|nr:GTP pyrophosphokinase family protein [Eubacterium sp.]
MELIGTGLFSTEEMRKTEKDIQRLLSYYQCALMETETKFRVLNEAFSLEHERNPINTIQTRLKTPQSIIEKMRRRNFPLNLESIEENLFDIAGIRAVCSFVDDVYFVANCLKEQDDVKILQVKDYIKEPKDNGYRSLHMIIELPIFLQSEKRLMKVEVQLRTIAMEFWANLDHKMRYKKNIDPEVEKKIADELLQCALLSADLDERMQNVRGIIDNEIL